MYIRPQSWLVVTAGRVPWALEQRRERGAAAGGVDDDVAADRFPGLGDHAGNDRDLTGWARMPVTVTPARTVTLGSACAAWRMMLSNSGRRAHTTASPGPSPRSSGMRSAPCAMSVSKTSGASARRTRTDRPRKLCGWRAWGTPGRGQAEKIESAPPAGKLPSRSTTVTWWPRRPRNKAAARPASPPPTTTAWSLLLPMGRLRAAASGRGASGQVLTWYSARYFFPVSSGPVGSGWPGRAWCRRAGRGSQRSVPTGAACWRRPGWSARLRPAQPPACSRAVSPPGLGPAGRPLRGSRDRLGPGELLAFRPRPVAGLRADGPPGKSPGSRSMAACGTSLSWLPTLGLHGRGGRRQPDRPARVLGRQRPGQKGQRDRDHDQVLARSELPGRARGVAGSFGGPPLAELKGGQEDVGMPAAPRLAELVRDRQFLLSSLLASARSPPETTSSCPVLPATRHSPKRLPHEVNSREPSSSHGWALPWSPPRIAATPQ